MFLWAILVIDDLIEGYSKGLTTVQLKDRLMKLPEDLQFLYDRLLDRLGRRGEDSMATAVMLYLALMSLQPLRLREFYIVFQFQMNGKHLTESRTESWVYDTFQKKDIGVTRVSY